MAWKEAQLRWCLTGIVLTFFLILGFNTGLLNPTLPDLQHLTQSTTTEISTLLIWTGVGIMLGAGVIGYLFDRFNWQLLLVLCILSCGVFVAIVPLTSHLMVMGIVLAIDYALFYGLFAGSLSLLMKLWFDDERVSASLLQLSSLINVAAYAIVAQMVKPFLGDFTFKEDAEGTTENSTSTPQNYSWTYMPNETLYQAQPKEAGLVQFAYITIAGIDILAGFLCAIFFSVLRKNSYEVFSKLNAQSKQSAKNESTNLSFLPRWYKVSVISLTFFTFLLSGGREMIINNLLYTYVKEFLFWTVEESTLLLTIFNLIRLFIQIPVVLIVRWVKPFTIVVADNLLFLLAPLLLIGSDISKVKVYISVCIIGVAVSNVNVTTLTYAKELIPPSGKLTGGTFVAAAIGQMMFSLLSGVLLQRNGAVGFPSVIAGLSGINLVLLIPWFYAARYKGNCVNHMPEENKM